MLQCVGIVLVSALCFLLTRSIRRRFLNYWALSWPCLTISLSALLIAFCQPVPVKPFYSIYFLGEYAFGYLFVSGCRNCVSGFQLSRRHWWVALPAVFVAVGLPLLADDFGILMVPHAAIVTSIWASAYWVLRPIGGVEPPGPGRRIVSLALLFLMVEFSQYTVTSVFNQFVGHNFSYMRYSSLYDLILEIFLAFGTVMIVMESVHRELEDANRELKGASDRLRALVEKDPLTDALNRHAFYSLVQNEQRYPSLSTTGSVAIVDMDDLKTINDSLGHAIGDRAIREVARALRSVIRADDLLFRWGGDEFLVVLVGLPESETRLRLDGLNAILQEASPTDPSCPTLAVSYGVSSFIDIKSLEATIDEADREMYRRKQLRKAGLQKLTAVSAAAD
jgi:diguanylate cyclase (GGDEF)-like protein